MESGLKQRLVGAAVLVALAVIFLPMLVQGPAPDSGVSNVPLTMPPAPRGDSGTRDLPLVTPGEAPAGGAVGLAPTVPADQGSANPRADAAQPAAAAAAPTQDAQAAQPAPSQPATDAALPAATAGGDYAVSFGAYASQSAADAVIASLKSAQLPAYREPTTSGGKPAWRVRIGPFATRAEAESARLRSAHVRDDVGAQVVVLDVAPAASTPAPAATPAQPVAAAPRAEAKPAAPQSAAPSASAPAPAPAAKPAPAAPKPPAASGTGFAVQLAAYSKPADATALRDRLRAAGFSAFTESVTTDKGALTRVRVGPVASRADAEQLQAQVKAKLGLDGIVRPHP
ncbi:MAG: SPOR domain-containing protein [Lysobacteraceae bacterium]